MSKFAETVCKILERRMQDSNALHFNHIKAALELSEARLDREASERTWMREALSHWKREVEPDAVRPLKTPRPCEVIQHTFADGSTMSRCLGVFADGRACAFGSGHSQPSFNSKRHKPEAVGVSAVGEIFAEYDEKMTPEREPVLIVEEGLLEEEAPEPIEQEQSEEENALQSAP